MTQIVLIGGGGFGRELLQYLRADIAAGRLPACTLAGVLDDRIDCEVVSQGLGLPYLGRLDDFIAQPDMRALVAVGSVRARVSIASRLAERSVLPFTYVHGSAMVAPDATIGEGTVVCPFSIVNSGARVGPFSAINVFCSIGHGAEVGAHSVLSPYSALNGNARIGARSFLGTRATVFPGVSLGDACVVDTHAFVKASVGDRKIVSVRGQYLVLDNRLGA